MIDLFYGLVWLFGIVFAPFAIVESVVSPDLKKRLSEFLKSKSHALDDLPPIAEQLFQRIFGQSHFSLRCFTASVAASLFFLTLMYVLRLLLKIATLDETTDAHQFIADELRYLIMEDARPSFVISITTNLILDYFALLKTRLIIAFLVRRSSSVFGALFATVADFVFSFLIFQTFYLIFYIVSLVFSFGYGRLILPAGEPHSLAPMIELMILLNFATNHAYPSGATLDFLMHSHAIGIFLFYTFVPLYLTSVFFYASVAPSIWLWLLVLAAIVSKAIAPSWPAALEVLNFEQMPLKMIGLMAGVLVVLFLTFGIFLLALGLSALSSLLG